MKINTNIPATPKRMEILHAVIGQMSDGIWETTRSMEKYWKSLDAEKGPDGNIWLEDRGYVCADLAGFFANKIKQILKIEADDNPNSGIEWDRSCAATTCYLNYSATITVGDCYELYELLKGRNTAKNSYSKYNDYKVTLSYNGMSVDLTVSALNDLSAKRKAVEELAKKLTATVVPV